MKQYFVYILIDNSGTFYTGVTNDLMRRIYEHKNGLVPGFTSQYNVTRLIYYEICEDINSAITREKQIKNWRREKKIALIDTVNPVWADLSEGWCK